MVRQDNGLRRSAQVIASYTGKGTLVVDGDKVPIMVHVEARHRELIGAVIPSAWTGRITAGVDAVKLIGREVTIEIPVDRSGTVVVGDAGGNFTGLGPPPL
jgi:hypothetical protein